MRFCVLRRNEMVQSGIISLGTKLRLLFFFALKFQNRNNRKSVVAREYYAEVNCYESEIVVQ